MNRRTRVAIGSL